MIVDILLGSVVIYFDTKQTLNFLSDPTGSRYLRGQQKMRRLFWREIIFLSVLSYTMDNAIISKVRYIYKPL
jgi:hypothetical protein